MVISIFSFSQNVLNPIKHKNYRLSGLFLSSANAFNLDQSGIFLLGEELRLTHKTRIGSCQSIFVAFVKNNATTSSIQYFENQVLYFTQNRRM